MASVAKQMADMLVEIRSVRQLLDDEIKRSRIDHDEQIGLRKDVQSLTEKLAAAEKRLGEKISDFERSLSETKKKKWDVVLTVISAFITAIAALLVYRAFSSGAVSTEPGNKTHSSISAPADSFNHSLRGESRGA